MNSQQTCEWFAEPLDVETNASFAGELPEENFFANVRCSDGRLRNLWQCSFNQIRFFWNSRSSGLDFRVFNRYANGITKGAIRELPASIVKKILSKKQKGLSHV